MEHVGQATRRVHVPITGKRHSLVMGLTLDFFFSAFTS